MVNRDRLRKLCGVGIFNNIPVENITVLRITHQRLHDNPATLKPIIAANGGFTKVDLVIGNIVFSGEAVCSLSDNFCKKTGRHLALVRAFRKYWKSRKGIEHAKHLETQAGIKAIEELRT